MTGQRLAGLLALALLTSCASLDPFSSDDLADRGIGGTGIVGVITAFGSVWVDGVEVEITADTEIDSDGRPVGAEELRLGQVAIIEASDTETGLAAGSISIRHEVSGPVEAVEDSGTLMIVAGQRVVLSGTVPGDAGARRGEWVAVSGIREPDGDIVATRIDKTLPGLVTVHGVLAGSGSSLRIGRLGLEGDIPDDLSAVTVQGRYQDGVLLAEAVSPDLLVSDPAAHFSDDIGRLLIETYVRPDDGLLAVDGGLLAVGGGTRPGGIVGGSTPVRAVVEFTRRPDGDFHATAARAAPDPIGPRMHEDLHPALPMGPPMAPPGGLQSL